MSNDDERLIEETARMINESRRTREQTERLVQESEENDPYPHVPILKPKDKS